MLQFWLLPYNTVWSKEKKNKVRNNETSTAKRWYKRGNISYAIVTNETHHMWSKILSRWGSSEPQSQIDLDHPVRFHTSTDHCDPFSTTSCFRGQRVARQTNCGAMRNIIQTWNSLESVLLTIGPQSLLPYAQTLSYWNNSPVIFFQYYRDYRAYTPTILDRILHTKVMFLKRLSRMHFVLVCTVSLWQVGDRSTPKMTQITEVQSSISTICNHLIRYKCPRN